MDRAVQQMDGLPDLSTNCLLPLSGVVDQPLVDGRDRAIISGAETCPSRVYGEFAAQLIKEIKDEDNLADLRLGSVVGKLENGDALAVGMGTGS
jgi:hypothetical protein